MFQFVIINEIIVLAAWTHCADIKIKTHHIKIIDFESKKNAGIILKASQVCNSLPKKGKSGGGKRNWLVGL